MAPIYDLVYSFKDYRKEAREIAAAVRKYADRRPRTLLDVACGTGSHLEHLRRSFEVEGVDIDPAMLRVARRRLPGVRLRVADYTDFDLGKQFDAVTCLFSAIAHAETLPKFERAVSRMGAHVAPGGVLVIEPWIMPSKYVPGKAGLVQADGGGLKIVRLGYVKRTGKRRVHTELHYLIRDRRGVKYRKEVFETGMYSDADYRRAFAKAGLVVRSTRGGPMGRGLYVGVKPPR
jgi:SAM-dependent methyltransferase